MSITDELREFMDRADGYELWCPRHKVELENIADRIDVAHRSALEKLAAQLDETSDMREFCGRIEQAANNREDVTLWGVDYIPLPVDADGVPIHVGDKIEYLSGGRDIVRFITLNGNGWLVNERGWEPYTMRHHCAQTVEDVLEDFYRTAKADSDANMGDLYETIAEYAAKLRLAGEDE